MKKLKNIIIVSDKNVWSLSNSKRETKRIRIGYKNSFKFEINRFETTKKKKKI